MHPSISLSPSLCGLYEAARYIDRQTVQALDEIAATLLCDYSAVVAEKAKSRVESGRQQMCCVALWKSAEEVIDDITRPLPFFSWRTSEVLREFTTHVGEAYSSVFTDYCRSLSPTGDLPMWWSHEFTRKARQERIQLLTDFHSAVLQSSVNIKEALPFI